MRNFHPDRSYRSYISILNELIGLKKIYKDSPIRQEIIDWAINVFCRRANTEKASLEELRKMYDLTTRNKIKVEFRTKTKMLINSLRNLIRG